jgi:hypothetical protein
MSYGGTCAYCGQPVDADYAAYRITGLEYTRHQGGPNAIHGRKRVPNWVAHKPCASKALRDEQLGIGPGQGTLEHIGPEVGRQLATAQARQQGYRLWVNAARTVLARVWDDGTAEVAVRATSRDTWGPPVLLTEEPPG